MYEMNIEKIIIYAEIDGKVCLIRNKCPKEILLNMISAFTDNKIEAIPLKDFHIKKLDKSNIEV